MVNINFISNNYFPVFSISKQIIFILGAHFGKTIIGDMQKKKKKFFLVIYFKTDFQNMKIYNFAIMQTPFQ